MLRTCRRSIGKKGVRGERSSPRTPFFHHILARCVTSVRNSFITGKFVLSVSPVIYAIPLLSTAILHSLTEAFEYSIDNKKMFLVLLLGIFWYLRGNMDPRGTSRHSNKQNKDYRTKGLVIFGIAFVLTIWLVVG